MNDTVQTPTEGTNTGNDVATEVTTTNETPNNPATEGQPTEAPATQSTGEQENTSATQDKDTPKDGDGKVTEADKDNAETGFDLAKLKLPDGVTVTDEEKTAFLADAEKLGIKTQDSAQKFVDWIFEKSKQANDMLAKQQQNDMGELEKQWDEEGKKDPVLGKDYDKNVSDAMETANQIFSPRTIEFLKETRFERNPDFLKDMLRIHKERADAELISGRITIPADRIKRDSQGNPMLNFK